MAYNDNDCDINTGVQNLRRMEIRRTWTDAIDDIGPRALCGRVNSSSVMERVGGVYSRNLARFRPAPGARRRRCSFSVGRCGVDSGLSMSRNIN